MTKEEILEFIIRNWVIILLLFGLFLVILYWIKNKICSIFSKVKYYNQVLLIISSLGFAAQLILIKNKSFDLGINITIFVSIIFLWLFMNRQKIENKEFNSCVVMFLIGQSAYCMISSNQKELYDYEIFHSIIYAGIYIGIPMFIAYEFASKEREISNKKEDISEKLKEIENKFNKADNKLNEIDNKLSEIEKSINKSSCSMISIFKRFK